MNPITTGSAAVEMKVLICRLLLASMRCQLSYKIQPLRLRKNAADVLEEDRTRDRSRLMKHT